MVLIKILLSSRALRQLQAPLAYRQRLNARPYVLAMARVRAPPFVGDVAAASRRMNAAQSKHKPAFKLAGHVCKFFHTHILPKILPRCSCIQYSLTEGVSCGRLHFGHGCGVAADTPHISFQQHSMSGIRPSRNQRTSVPLTASRAMRIDEPSASVSCRTRPRTLPVDEMRIIIFLETSFAVSSKGHCCGCKSHIIFRPRVACTRRAHSLT